jgi:sialidase-1
VDHGPDTIGNPAPVQDVGTGVVWLLLTGNPGNTGEKEIIETGAMGTRTVWVMSSKDEGVTWSKPAEITKDVKPTDWTWYATGPVNGIQTRSGRLVIPCDHEVKGHRGFYSHVIYSDDHGARWKLGGSASEMTDESTVAELTDGSLMLNMRSNAKRFRRAVSLSKDGGLTWSAPRFDDALIEPTCQASLIRYARRGKGGKAGLLFSNPASEKRVRMTVRHSDDDGRTWRHSKLVHEGPSAYSSLAALKDGTIGLLYEKGAQQAYESIAFARFTFEWLTK